MKTHTLIAELEQMPIDQDHFENEHGYVMVKIPGMTKVLPQPDKVTPRDTLLKLCQIERRGNVYIKAPKYITVHGYLEKNCAGEYFVSHYMSDQVRGKLEPCGCRIKFQLTDVHDVDVPTKTIILK